MEAELVCRIGELYEIIWEDVVGGGGAWTSLSEIETELGGEKTLFKTAGYVVRTTKGRVILAGSVEVHGEIEDATLGHWTAIPRVLIKKMKCLS